MKPESGELAAKVAKIGEGHVTWKGLVQTSLVVGSLTAGIGGCIYSADVAHETQQNAEIRAKADKADVQRSYSDVVAELHLLRADISTIMAGLAKLTGLKLDETGRVIGQVQNQEQSVHVTDWVKDAMQKEFVIRRRQMLEYDPCTGKDKPDGGLLNAWDGEGACTTGVRRGRGSTGSEAFGELGAAGNHRREQPAAAGSD